MPKNTPHTFHIPVMGLGYTIDTPIKVAKYGISSVVSIMEDFLIEEMRKVHSINNRIEYVPIATNDIDYRAKRITAYLNFLQDRVDEQILKIKNEEFIQGSDLMKYFLLLPESSIGKLLYNKMLDISDIKIKKAFQDELRTFIKAGSIDVNIMTKVDKRNYSKDGELLPNEYSDAQCALRGFANSKLSSSVIFSAGMNPKLFTYCENFEDFYPDANGKLKKKIILKVSDFRSAVVQGKMFAKKGLWISEFRIESGLNCGGHAFATQGFLLGPILEEFKEKRDELYSELMEMCVKALIDSNKNKFIGEPLLKITAQGGIGTSEEDLFLMNNYNLDGTGWGSPFLLVPETTNVDEVTLKALVKAKREDYYLSNSSPLGVPFNNFKNCSSEEQRLDRIAKNRPGSPCYKKFLSVNTEFTDHAICTASREYQKLKIEQIEKSELSLENKTQQISKVIEKDCLCEGLGTAALLKNHGTLSHKLEAVSICPGPNLSFFSDTYKLSEMVDHIYGRYNILKKVSRPNVFINEAYLYIDYLKKEIEDQFDSMNQKQHAYFLLFKENLEKGLAYYSELVEKFTGNYKSTFDSFHDQIDLLKEKLNSIVFKEQNALL